ncbi:phosphoenolpyruvate--protein phosphotransferase [Pseudomonas vanderleydeniana]|uniref:phosphoenolpyruvate--protein phosphotransferase n=1 Tax=Pseudomonas vanderleydeniana TaxID=2745495 RepID=A0A9E6PN82_9PSED|nr:phosphoenolpyruvate--protein phosphotransferase [Pseudomonas vanderleydeniana]QXI29598.1 phosphoenolpyruvate--protein phosphotransferase [Pseudomonas vanderleydeniana]
MHNNNNELTLGAPLSGPVMPLFNIDDAVFASGALGDGIAIDPLNDSLHAPCGGVIVQVARTLHALTLRADNGAELLLHLGLDTVALEGEGFTLLVGEGARVEAGQALLRFDLDQVARHSRSLVSPLVLTNGEHYELRARALESVKVGDPVLQIVPRQTPRAAATPESSDDEVRRHARVAHRGGLHARPAALLRQTAQRFDCSARLHLGDRSASLDSLIGIMGLGVEEQAQVEISCRGKDREAAIQALLQVLQTPLAEDHPHAAPPPPIASRPVEAGVLHGVCAAPGLVSGPLARLQGIQLPPDPGGHDAQEQRQALNSALEQVRSEIRATEQQALSRGDHAEQAIFNAHLALLEDPALLDTTHQAITHGSAATHAWSQAIDSQCQVLLELGNPLLAERTNDLRDLRQRVLRALLGEACHYELPQGAIVVAQELTPSDLLLISQKDVAGLCMAEGGATSHVAILARARGLPCLVALGPALLEIAPGQQLVLDADHGRLELTPDQARLEGVAIARWQHQLRRQRQQERGLSPAQTRDGRTIEVAANVASAAEARQAHLSGADGVGLLRTEFLFVDRRTAPDEREQLDAYQAVVDAMGDKPVIIRTIDVGGDKQLDYLPLPAEANPVLGLRGIRLAQARPQLLEQQLRALLQVNPAQRCRILLPMVSEVDELLQIRRCLERLAGELGISQLPELGVMIEVPSAALLAGQLAEHADFLSIGTNDLSQYTLAMDRDHAGLAGRVDALHPAILQLIASTCAGAARHQRWVGVCGALASDPLATPVLIGLGISELSVSPPQIGEIKERVRHLDAAECRRISASLLQLGSAASVREACRQHWPLD